MWVLDLVKAGVAAYNTVDKKISDATWWKKNIKSIATDTVEKLKTKTVQPSVSTTNWSKYQTYDTSKIQSTVTNPSQIFKGISKEDEDLIMKIVNDRYAWASKIEKNNAIQWLYDTLLKQQKSKDIEAGREKIKLELTNQKNNAKSKKEKNTYNVQIKKADLADLIKDQLVKQWYKSDDMLWIVDDSIIDWFVEANPQYLSSFQKYFYNDQDIVELGKDLWWIEKTTTDKVIDKAKGIGKGMVGWIDKFWEWVDETLWLAKKDESAWLNYVQDNYWTYPMALTDEDYNKARAEFLLADKKEYTPTISSAVTKLMEWGADILFTSMWLSKLWNVAKATSTLWAGWLQTVNPSAWQVAKNVAKNPVWAKTLFATASETPYLDKVPETLWWAIWLLGYGLNQIPWFSDIRDNLRTEEDKADWDAFVGWNILSLFRSGKKTYKDSIKDIDIQWWKESFDKLRQGKLKESINTLKENNDANKKKKLTEQKLEQAQRATQWEIETRETLSRALDLLNKKWKLTKDNGTLKKLTSWNKERPVTLDELSESTNELVDTIKWEQRDLFKWKKYWDNDLALAEDVNILDKEWNTTTRKQMNRAFSALLDDIIEHYEEVDKSKATTYKSYKQALKNWNLPWEIALDIRREWNRLNQWVYNDKTNLAKDTAKAKKWEANIKKVNDIFESLDIWEDVRTKDSQLSSLYTLQDAIERVKKAESNYNKKAIKDWTADSIAKSLWAFVSRVLGKLSFWWTNLAWKAAVSALQETLGWRWFTKETYNAAEIANKIPEFISDYKKTLDQLNWKEIDKGRANRIANAFIDKWIVLAPYSAEEDK